MSRKILSKHSMSSLDVSDNTALWGLQECHKISGGIRTIKFGIRSLYFEFKK